MFLVCGRTELWNGKLRYIHTHKLCFWATMLLTEPNLNKREVAGVSSIMTMFWLYAKINCKTKYIKHANWSKVNTFIPTRNSSEIQSRFPLLLASFYMHKAESALCMKNNTPINSLSFIFVAVPQSASDCFNWISSELRHKVKCCALEMSALVCYSVATLNNLK